MRWTSGFKISSCGNEPRTLSPRAYTTLTSCWFFVSIKKKNNNNNNNNNNNHLPHTCRQSETAIPVISNDCPFSEGQFFISIPVCFNPQCGCPEYTIVHYTGRHNNSWCETKCRQDVNGFLAIPFTQDCYNKLVSTTPATPEGWVTPVWTGIKVRATGLYDPRNNNTINMYGNQPNPANPLQRTSYGTFLVGDAYTYRTTGSKKENCIYYAHGFYVESKCTFLHEAPSGPPIMCACSRGKHTVLRSQDLWIYWVSDQRVRLRSQGDHEQIYTKLSRLVVPRRFEVLLHRQCGWKELVKNFRFMATGCFRLLSGSWIVTFS